MEWHDKTFDELSTKELFQIYYLRTQVFNDEQHSTYPDPDYQDLTAHHVLVMQDGHLVAYARYFVEDDYATFGRVVVAKANRGAGLGKTLIRHILQQIQGTFPGKQVKIHAQYYVKDFYHELGFVPVGEPFIEAERKHIQMTYQG